jgi:PAS domain S-box-containing protein
MNSLGLFFSLFAGALQLTIPSYALRLIRRFGVDKVGWFIASAFVCLGMLHLFDPLRSVKGLGGSGIPFDAVYAVASVLLLIGMAHVDTLVAANADATQREKRLKQEAERQIEERISTLQWKNEELTTKVASLIQRERTLEESEACYRFLFLHNPQAMWIVDLRSCHILAVNKAALAQYALTEQEFVKAGATGLVPAEGREAFLQDIKEPCSGIQLRGRWPLRRNDGTILETEITAIDMKYGDRPARLILGTDLTSRRQEQEQSLETQRLRLIGKVAGGVAHHFNNILTVISGNTELLERTASGDETKTQLSQISTATHRAACLTQQLLAAGGAQLLQPAPLNLNSCLKRLASTLERVAGDRIVIENRLAPDLPLVMADARAVESIVVGLALNARDAMSGKGTLTLSTKVVRISEFEARNRNDKKAGEFVCLSVRDTGCGMTPETRARLYEPFFTTQDIGKAAGLGLASTYGLAKQHSGWIECVSEINKGTDVKLFLPVAPNGAAVANAPTTKLSTGTVLLIEPDERTRALARYILNRQGYSVIECDGAEIALNLWESEQVRVNLVLTATTLPGRISGFQLVKHLQTTKPGLKAVYLYGSADQDQQEMNTLTKPYTAEGLLAAIESGFASV